MQFATCGHIGKPVADDAGMLISRLVLVMHPLPLAGRPSLPIYLVDCQIPFQRARREEVQTCDNLDRSTNPLRRDNVAVANTSSHQQVPTAA